MDPRWRDRPGAGGARVAGGTNRATPAGRPAETPPVPEGLDWDLWLGPAKARPFHPVYAPLMFHYWWDFGTGTLGNFGCHTLDTPVWALDLEHPVMVEASSTTLSAETTPEAAMYHYRFPSRGDQPAVELFWYDGGLRPPRPECLEPDRDLPLEGGSLMVGDKGACYRESGAGRRGLFRSHAVASISRRRPRFRGRAGIIGIGSTRARVARLPARTSNTRRG